MTKLSVCAAVAAVAPASIASADLLYGWTIPTAVPAGTDSFGYDYGAADQGSFVGGYAGKLYGEHHSGGGGSTSFTSPSGNGSQYSLSSNNWMTGDFYEIVFRTSGYGAISVTWDQGRNPGGPSTFDAQVSVDGGLNFTTVLAGYSVQMFGLPQAGLLDWTPENYQSQYTRTLNLGEIANNRPFVVVRFASTVDTFNGMCRIDNIMVNGSAVPTPGAVALLGLAGLAARRRR